MRLVFISFFLHTSRNKFYDNRFTTDFRSNSGLTCKWYLAVANLFPLHDRVSSLRREMTAPVYPDEPYPEDNAEYAGIGITSVLLTADTLSIVAKIINERYS